MLRIDLTFIRHSPGCRPPIIPYPGQKIILDIRSLFGTIYEPEVIKMNITSDIKPVTYLKSKAADLLNQINETHRPVIITQNGEPRAVLQDPESYENMRNAIGMLKLISQGEIDVRNGRVNSQEDVFNDVENSLKEKL
jgi:prevent-host-death family protein